VNGDPQFVGPVKIGATRVAGLSITGRPRFAGICQECDSMVVGRGATMTVVWAVRHWTSEHPEYGAAIV
jgi:hypothetical protein